jgi:coenzyme F420-reducing hydrogenase beta subunit
MESFLVTNNKNFCYGCGACKQICPKSAIIMSYDSEGFQYPLINQNLCIHCGLCQKICPAINYGSLFYSFEQKAYGGYLKDKQVLNQSTSGGAFSAIANAFCSNNYVVFGVEGNGLTANHVAISNLLNLSRIRRSKYVQSDTKMTFFEAKKYLDIGKKVLFSGTPCQIAALRCFLNKEYENLLTVEVVCEGVPSPLFIQKQVQYIEKKKNKKVISCDYRYKNINKWDFEQMHFQFSNGNSSTRDRWFNSFWEIWLNHLMSRPSCYNCPFATRKRIADITLGDLWGVHIYCPDLYNENRGASLMIANTPKGENIINGIGNHMIYHSLDLETSIKYQSPIRHPIAENKNRLLFIKDLQTLDYVSIVKKWYTHPSIKLIYQKYCWGNRQKVFCWRLLKGLKNN